MSEHYPRIRVRVESGPLLVREAVSITFYLRHSHVDVARAVRDALEHYRRSMPPQEFRQYSQEAEAWTAFDTVGWEHVQRKLLERKSVHLNLWGGEPGEKEYRFIYRGQPMDPITPWGDEPDRVCAVGFWLPTEYLEEQGPDRVRTLALELGATLPFSSGQAGLAFQCETDVLGTWGEVLERGFRYPSLEIPDPDLLSSQLGTRVRTVNWLTFLGQPVLGEVGGVAGLRSQLSSPGTSVQEMNGERAVVTLGPWPEAGDTEQGKTLPAHRELARVLKPWLYVEKLHAHAAPDNDVLRWERRFLD